MYRWPGTHYTGTVDINGTIIAMPRCQNDSSSKTNETSMTFAMRQPLEGILHIGSTVNISASDSNDANMFVFGFEKGARIPDKWVEAKGYAPNVKILLSSTRGNLGVRNVLSGPAPKRMWDIDCTWRNRSKDDNGRYALEGDYIGYTLDDLNNPSHLNFNPDIIGNDNFFNISSALKCGRKASDWIFGGLLDKVPGDELATNLSSNTHDSTAISGHFDGNTANITFTVHFFGTASQTRAGFAENGHIPADDKLYGVASIGFRGKVEKAMSDQLLLGKRGRLTWNITVERPYGIYSNSASRGNFPGHWTTVMSRAMSGLLILLMS
ncbi:hypothetical protein VTO42DRAFT_1063 [Malbranchea cinnamomea]